jgi:hypothetical protein
VKKFIRTPETHMEDWRCNPTHFYLGTWWGIWTASNLSRYVPGETVLVTCWT